MYLLYPVTAGGYAIYAIPSDKTAEELATSFGLTMAQCAEFDLADFDPACLSFQYCFTLVDNQPEPNGVDFSLPEAKKTADLLVNQQSNEAAAKVMAGLSYDVYVAQASLPAEQRIVKYQAAIDANNANAVETEQREQAVYAATTIDQVYAIVYPTQAE
jgi:hypothetical protein